MPEPFDFVLGQMNHLGYKNWDCGCKRNAATAVMTRNYPRDDGTTPSKELNLNRPTPFRAIACGASYSDPVRVAAMLAQTMPWDEIIIVGNREGPLYDHLRVVKTLSELPPIDSFDCNKRTLVIFDECCVARGKADMKVMYDFSIRGRLRGVSTLFVEMDLLSVPKWVRRNADVLYLTTDPRRGWKEIKWLLHGDAPIADCFAALSRPGWFKIDIRSRETEVIDASKYYPTHDREEEKVRTWLGVHMQMWHVCQKTCIETDGECGCEKRNAAIAVMARNFPHHRR